MARLLAARGIMDSGTQIPVTDWRMPMPAFIWVFLKKFSQNMAMDQLGMM